MGGPLPTVEGAEFEPEGIEDADHQEVHHLIEAGGLVVPGGNGRGNAGPRFRQGGEIAQVDQVPGKLPRRDHQRSPFLEMHIRGPLDQIEGHA